MISMDYPGFNFESNYITSMNQLVSMLENQHSPNASYDSQAARGSKPLITSTRDRINCVEIISPAILKLPTNYFDGIVVIGTLLVND